MKEWLRLYATFWSFHIQKRIFCVLNNKGYRNGYMRSANCQTQHWLVLLHGILFCWINANLHFTFSSLFHRECTFSLIKIFKITALAFVFVTWLLQNRGIGKTDENSVPSNRVSLLAGSTCYSPSSCEKQTVLMACSILVSLVL